LFICISYGIKNFLKTKEGYGLALAGISIALALGSITLSPFHYPPVMIIFLLVLLLTACNNKEVFNKKFILKDRDENKKYEGENVNVVSVLIQFNDYEF
jgi:hypothetical protein